MQRIERWIYSKLTPNQIGIIAVIVAAFLISLPFTSEFFGNAITTVIIVAFFLAASLAILGILHWFVKTSVADRIENLRKIDEKTKAAEG